MAREDPGLRFPAVFREWIPPRPRSVDLDGGDVMVGYGAYACCRRRRSRIAVTRGLVCDPESASAPFLDSARSTTGAGHIPAIA